jgi:hypothetical protein
MQRTEHPACETPCQDCKQRPWKTGLATPRGRVYLCWPCYEQASGARESNDERRQDWFRRLLTRVFGGAA